MFKNALATGAIIATVQAGKNDDDYEIAICRMQINSGTTVNPADTANNPGGFFSLRQKKDGSGILKIAGVGFNLSPETSHAFHIHAGPVDFTADPATTANVCATSGGHFNPDTTLHGAWDNDIADKHVGDLMQLWTDSLGKSVYAYETMYGNIVDSSDDYYVVGNAMTIHKLVDDEGLVDSDASRKGGSAGERIACCNIELSNSKRYNRIWEDLEELIEDELEESEDESTASSPSSSDTDWVKQTHDDSANPDQI